MSDAHVPANENRRPSEDPDQRIARWGWFLWVIWLIVGGVLTALLVRVGGLASIVIVLIAPFWGAWLLWLIIRGARRYRGWVEASVWGEWNGSYFEFDGRQMRVLFDGDSIYIAAADVFDACGIGSRGRDIERARVIAGRDGVVPAPDTRLMCFTERGFRAWMERRTDQASGKFVQWFDRQVVSPYRRRREIGYPTPEQERELDTTDKRESGN